MTALPAANSFAFATDPNSDDFAADLEAMRTFVAQLPGGATQGALTIAGGIVTPTTAAFTVDTEAAAATDDLDTIALTNFPDGSWFVVAILDAAKTVRLTSAGNIILRDATTLLVTSASDRVLFMRVGASCVEIYRSSGNRWRRVQPLTANTTLVPSDTGSTITNTGAGSDLNHILPAASVGAEFRVRVTAAHKIKLTAAGTDTIRDNDGTTVSGAGGFSEIAAVVGNYMNLECFESGKWVETGARGMLSTV